MAIPAERLDQAHGMFELAERLKDLKAQKKAGEDHVKALNAEIEKVDQQLVESMIETEMQSFNKSGSVFYLNTKTFASAVADRKPELFEWLKENGYGAMVQETVNAMTLAAWVREQLEEKPELPEELQPLLNVYEKTTVGIRKAR